MKASADLTAFVGVFVRQPEGHIKGPARCIGVYIVTEFFEAFVAVLLGQSCLAQAASCFLSRFVRCRLSCLCVHCHTKGIAQNIVILVRNFTRLYAELCIFPFFVYSSNHLSNSLGRALTVIPTGVLTGIAASS